MILNSNQITVDIKVADRYREIISKLGSATELKCVMLGDSDIDYETTQDISKVRILNAPYNPESIKYPLIYNGLGNGVSGTITSFVRFVDSEGNVSSYYEYPLNENISSGRIPPTLKNGIDKDSVAFTNERMGVIIFLQTLLDYYRTEEGIQQRLKETYEVKIFFNNVETIPNGWQLINDFANGSFLLSKDNINLQDGLIGIQNGLITIKGNISNIEKNITFNI